MPTQEFYIRNASETDARGPFTMEQLISLAETGQVTPETLYYEAQSEQWMSIGDNAEIKEAVFPEKKKLALKKDAKVAMLNKESETHPGIDVGDMLAAAEGRTKDTEDKSAHLVMADRCAKFGIWGGILMLLLAAVGEIAPSIDVLTNFSIGGLLKAPLVILGVFDIVLGLLLLLGVIAMYPVVRFRAMLGLGFLGFLFWTQNQNVHLAAAAAGSVGLYVSTVFLSYIPLGIGLLLGIGGMGALSYLLFIG